ncbi:MAG: cysteine desulfurase, cysteine desulfurase [Candidatus Saccharibacteria bacterium]|nr:cysteine desulfurase, cysteine desulfurase [Candidatus Saccharibacteria bacterium]
MSVYLDHAAATPLDPAVLAAMQPYFSEAFYNPSSPYAPAVAVRRDYEAAKGAIASTIGAKSGEITMTAGATESINLAFASGGGHIVTTVIEHQSVLAAAARADHTLVDVDKNGRVDPANIGAAIRPDTWLVSVALANNEIGTIQPLGKIAEIIKQIRDERLAAGNTTPLYLHSDASQGAGQLDMHVTRLGVDMLTLNAAKVYGPKQVGLLYAARTVRLSPQIVGGGQESGLRSGTENVAGVIGFAKALQQADEHRHSEVMRLSKLRDDLQKRLTDAFEDAVISGHHKYRLAGHLHISFPGLDAERLIFGLEARDVLVATGSACAANKGTRSHVLDAIGLEPSVADGSLRISLGKATNQAAIDLASEAIIAEVQREKERLAR